MRTGGGICRALLSGGAALWLAIMLLISMAPIARSEFFWRKPRAANTQFDQMGGTSLYSSAVEVNGAPGTLGVYTFEISPAALLARLGGQVKSAATLQRKGALLTLREKGLTRRLIVLPVPDTSGASLVLAFDQRAGQTTPASRKTPTWPGEIPALAAEPLFTATCARTRTAFVTAETLAAPAAAAAEAAATLTAAGWSEMPPASDTFKIFSEGRRQCVLFACEAPGAGRTTISLLQRDGAH